MEKTALAEIMKWCDLWLDGETNSRYTPEFVLGLRNSAAAALSFEARNLAKKCD